MDLMSIVLFLYMEGVSFTISSTPFMIQKLESWNQRQNQKYKKWSKLLLGFVQVSYYLEIRNVKNQEHMCCASNSILIFFSRGKPRNIIRQDDEVKIISDVYKRSALINVPCYNLDNNGLIF